MGLLQLRHAARLFSIMTVRRTVVSQEEPGVAIGVISAEKLYARCLESYAAAAAEMKLRPPFVVELGAVGLKGVYKRAMGLEVLRRNVEIPYVAGFL